MSKKLFLLTSVVLVLALANSVFAQGDPNWPVNYWSGWGDGSSWDDANNWYTANYWWDETNYPTQPARFWSNAPNSVPDADRIVLIGEGTPWYQYPNDLNSVGATGFPVVDGNTTAVCYQVFVSTGANDTRGPGRLDMTGGALTVQVTEDDWLALQIGNVPDGNGVVNLSGGTMTLVATDGPGGLLTVGGYNYWDPAPGGGVGTFNQTGGEVYCYHMDCPESDAAYEMTDPCLMPIGYINLHGGTFYTVGEEDWTEFWMGEAGNYPESRIDVTDGKAVIKSRDDNEQWWINLWIDEGKITAFGGAAPRAELYVSYNSGAGETTLQAISTELGQAWNPSPRPGRIVDYRPALSWSAGDYASQHDVYFGTDKTAVENATTSSPEYKPPRLALGTTSYDPFTDPCLFELDKVYYWRIDEVNASGVAEWKGLVWEFRTAKYLVVDDFEDYTNNPELYAVWDDGFVNYSGSYVTVEMDVNFVRSGTTSMMYEYQSAFKSGGTCYGSIADTDTTRLGISSNWEASGIKALVLYFSGDPGNSATADDQLWLQLEDTSSVSGLVLYDDMNDLALSSWSEWNIDLSIFDACGVSLANVDKIHIGFGGPTVGGNCKSGGTGAVHFDDIGLYPTRCVPEYGPDMDLNGDCIVDYSELEMVVDDWLLHGYDLNSTPPATGPIARYTFDTEGGVEPTVINTGSLGSAANGTMSSGPPPTATVSFVSPGAAHPDACDPNYSALFAGGADGHIAINSDFNSITTGGLTTNTMTLTCWVKRDGPQEPWTGLVYCSRNDGSTWEGSVCHAGLSLGDNADWLEGDSTDHFAYHWDTDPNTEEEVGWMWRAPIPVVPDGEWTFGAVAVSRDEASLYMYSGGNMYAATNYVYHVPTTFSDPFNLGRDIRGSWGGARTLNGELDDVRIYDYTLSASEVLYVAGVESTHVSVPSSVDFDSSDSIDFVDYGYIADEWLLETLWP